MKSAQPAITPHPPYTRETKYCRAIRKVLSKTGHATNAELHRALLSEYPNVSATTVHRATARLATRGAIAVAPPAKDGSMRYDADTSPHDHFTCRHCDLIKDTNLSDTVIPLLRSQVAGCTLTGNIEISGTCHACRRNVHE